MRTDGEPTRDARCPRCEAYWWPLDERLHAALTEAGFDGTDANNAVNAVLSVVMPPARVHSPAPAGHDMGRHSRRSR